MCVIDSPFNGFHCSTDGGYVLTNAATHQQREGKEVTDGDGEINVINAQTSKKKSALKMFYEREKKHSAILLNLRTERNFTWLL